MAGGAGCNPFFLINCKVTKRNWIMNKDLIAENLGWLDGIMTDPGNDSLFEDRKLSGLQKELSSRWTQENRIELLTDLAARYGEADVLTVIDIIIDSVSRKNWGNEGRRQDNSLENFITMLWGPLKDKGFEYTCETSPGKMQFTVTKCPLVTLAKITGTETWLYHLACLTDEPSVTGFNNKIRFTRNQTLMQGHPVCNHGYEVLP
jgi:predicted ArsR family transcriptional regulator